MTNAIKVVNVFEQIGLLLEKDECTFSECTSIAEMLSDHIKYKKLSMKYETTEDYYNCHKTKYVDNDIFKFYVNDID